MSHSNAWCSEKAMATVKELAYIADVIQEARKTDGAKYEAILPSIVGALHNATKVMAFHLGGGDENAPIGWSVNDASMLVDKGVAAFDGLVKRYEARDDAGYRASMEAEAKNEADEQAKKKLH